MTTEKEDQKQPRILEEAVTTDKKERRLTPEAEIIFRKYQLKYLTVPGIILFVLSFLGGVLIDRVAFQTGYNQAFLSAQSEVMKLVHDVMIAKSEVDAATKSIQASSSEIRRSEERAKKFEEDLSSLRSKLDSTVAFQASNVQIKQIADILARDPRITKVMEDLDASIHSRLKKADGEIEELKLAYRIDCLKGNFLGGIFWGLVLPFLSL